MKVARPVQLLKCDRGIAALEFAILAPALLALVFGIITYSIYLTASVGVRQAAAEGARAAVAGLSFTERDTLAKTRATQVLQNYSSVLGATMQPTITTIAGSGATLGTFTVTVNCSMAGSGIMRYNFVPLPTSSLTASVTVTNGGY